MKKISITLGLLAVLVIVAVVYFLVKNNGLEQQVVTLEFEKTSLDLSRKQILEKAKNYLISEGRTIIPGSGLSCSDKVEECLDYWTNKLASEVQQKPCDFTNNEVGCGRNDLKIISPNGGENLCVGDEVIISWKSPADAEAVTLKLREGGLFEASYNVGTFPASFNETGDKNGEGTTVWKMPQYIKESMVYKLWINTVYKGASVNDSSDDSFTIRTCQG